MNQNRSQWASNLGFILAAAGSAIGLGNIWKFPGKVGAYGGGAFILCYIAMVALIGFPVMLAELSMGRATQKNVVGAFHQLNRKWTFAGGIGMVTLFVILSYYAVVGGWVMKYIFVYLMGGRCLSDVFCQFHREAGGTAHMGTAVSCDMHLCGSQRCVGWNREDEQNPDAGIVSDFNCLRCEGCDASGRSGWSCLYADGQPGGF